MPIHQSLPDDAIVEIISRLPVKSVIRFKCISKSWYALISDPHFVIKHFISTNNHEFLLISHIHPVKRQVFSFLSFDSLEIQSKCFQLSSANLHEETLGFAQILGPCNGVFCLVGGKDGMISLWNPATWQVKCLPQSQVEPPPDVFTLDVCVGFGLDPKTNDYKVLAYKRMCFPSSATVAHAELYTLSTNKWRKIDVGQEFQPTGNLPHSSYNPSIDGVFSWFETDNHGERVIFSFDMKTEVFIKTKLPDYDGIPSKRVHGSLTSLKNFLAFIHDYPPKGISTCFDVWVLGEYGVRESWIRQLSIGPIEGVTKPFVFWNNGRLLLENTCGKIVSYDPITQDMRDLQARGVDKILRVLPYKESLACIKGAKDESDKDRDVNIFSVCDWQEESIVQMQPLSDD